MVSAIACVCVCVCMFRDWMQREQKTVSVCVCLPHVCTQVKDVCFALMRFNHILPLMQRSLNRGVFDRQVRPRHHSAT